MAARTRKTTPASRTSRARSAAPEPETTECMTAFMVIVDRDGNALVSTGPFPGIEPDHVATLTDLETYCSQVSKDSNRELIVRAVRPPVDLSTGARVGQALAKRKGRSTG